MERYDTMERYNEDVTLNPLLGLGLKAEIPVTDSEKTLAVILKLIEEQGEENRKLRLEIKKLDDRLDTQDLLNMELFKRLSAIEDGELDIVPLSNTNIGDLIKFKGLDQNMTTALMYLEKKKTLYVRDLKRLGIKFNFNQQYIRYLQKIGKISGYPVKQTKHALWYVEKSEKPEEEC